MLPQLVFFVDDQTGYRTGGDVEDNLHEFVDVSLRTLANKQEDMRDEKDRRHNGQKQAAPETEPYGPKDNGEIAEAAIGIMVKEKVPRGKEMEQADSDDNDDQKGEKGFSHGFNMSNLLVIPTGEPEKGLTEGNR